MDAASPRGTPLGPSASSSSAPREPGRARRRRRLAAYLGVPRISTGDMLRDAIANGTPLGKEAEPLMGQGNAGPRRAC